MSFKFNILLTKRLPMLNLACKKCFDVAKQAAAQRREAEQVSFRESDFMAMADEQSRAYNIVYVFYL